jgi:hypothetical protein
MVNATSPKLKILLIRANEGTLLLLRIYGLKSWITPWLICSHLFFFHSYGKLDRTVLLRPIFSGFQETTDPPVCYIRYNLFTKSKVKICISFMFLYIVYAIDLKTNYCVERNGVCWIHSQNCISASKVNTTEMLGLFKTISFTLFFLLMWF